MKTVKVFLVSFLLILSISSYSAPLVDIPIKIFDSMKVGNAAELANYFNSSVELVILNNEDIYSKQQAELVLRRFFSDNKVESFSILHQGGKDGAKYAIGNLQANNKSFRVYFLVKDTNGKALIHQLRIEEE